MLVDDALLINLSCALQVAGTGLNCLAVAGGAIGANPDLSLTLLLLSLLILGLCLNFEICC